MREPELHAPGCTIDLRRLPAYCSCGLDRLREHYRPPIFHAPAPEPEGWPVEVDPPCDIHTCDLCHPHQRINRRLNILQVQYLCLLAVVVILEWKVLW